MNKLIIKSMLITGLFLSSNALAHPKYNPSFNIGTWSSESKYSYDIATSGVGSFTGKDLLSEYSGLQVAGLSAEIRAEDVRNYYYGDVRYGRGIGKGNMSIPGNEGALSLSETQAVDSMRFKVGMGGIFDRNKFWADKTSLGIAAGYQRDTFVGGEKGNINNTDNIYFSGKAVQSQYNFYVDLNIEKELYNDITLLFDSNFILFSSIRTDGSTASSGEANYSDMHLSSQNYGWDGRLSLRYERGSFATSAGIGYIFGRQYKTGLASLYDESGALKEKATLNKQDIDSINYSIDFRYFF